MAGQQPQLALSPKLHLDGIQSKGLDQPISLFLAENTKFCQEWVERSVSVKAGQGVIILTLRIDSLAAVFIPYPRVTTG